MNKMKVVNVLTSLALAATTVFTPSLTALAADVAAPVIVKQETSVPETSVPETAAPETSVPETAAPETEVPETTTPQPTDPQPETPDATEKITPAVADAEVTRSGDNLRIYLDDNATQEWIDSIGGVVFDGTELRPDQYDVKAGRRGTSLVIKRTDEEPLVTNADRETMATLKVTAEGYEDLEEELTLINYGAKSFQIRIVGKDDKIYPQKTFTWDELEEMIGEEDAYYNTICGMAGLRTFKTQGVLLTDLLDAAGVTFEEGMELQVRTNDCAETENDSATDNAYYRNGRFTYENLMGTPRYFFNGVYEDADLRAELLSAMENDTVSDDIRKIIGKADKTLVEPMIGLRYVESMYSDEDMDAVENAPYSDMIENERAMRFLFGLKMDEADPSMLSEETTTWSATYCAFGVDIIDPEYIGEAPAVEDKEVTRGGGDLRIYLDDKATQEWIESIGSVAFNGAELRPDQYDVTAGRRGTTLVIKRTDEDPLVTNADRETKSALKVTAEGYKDLEEELTLINYGAKSFQIRIVDKNGKIHPKKTFTWDELEAMAGKEDAYYNTICGMAGLRTFKTQGVLLTDLLDAAGVKFEEGMELQVRTNDSAETENDSATDNAYYRNGRFTYENLMGTPRYFFNGLYEDTDLREELLHAMENDTVSEDIRKIIGKADKTACGPMIGLRYVESMYSDADMDAVKNAPYSEMIENEKAMRFLFGLKMDEADPSMLSEETTTWSATYCAFGIDIIYPEEGGSSGGGGFVPPEPPVKPDKPEQPEQPEMNFTDVNQSDYYYDSIQWAVKNEVTNGFTDTTFAPNLSCTRAQMVTFLWRAAASPEPETNTLIFTDVSADAYFAKAVMWAVEQGITKGVTETTFIPDATVTRAQTVTFLWRAAKSPASGTTDFVDVPADAYYAEAVAWAGKENITNGMTETQFQPDADCTRGQIVTFLYRYLGK